MEMNGAMKFLRMMLLVSAFFSLEACAMVDSATKGPTPNDKSAAPRVYYAGVEGLKMYSESSFKGAPIARLPLHEKVLRYKMERGFAYVKVPGTGQTGWVRNRDLVWRTPAPSKKRPETASAPPAEPGVESLPHQPPEVNHEPDPEKGKRDASMFDAL